MKDFLEYFFRNLWNFVSLVGLIATFYFSIFHVPDYFRKFETSTIQVMHESLVDDLQELLFHGKDVSINDIEALIKGEELKYDVQYPYSPDELLVQIQENFMGNKFIDLALRDQLFKKISSIAENYKPETEPQKTRNFLTGILANVVAVLGAALSMLSATSLVRKFQRDREIEVDLAAEDILIKHGETSSSFMQSAIDYENQIYRLLKKLGVVSSGENLSEEKKFFDFETAGANGEFVVEVKYYSRLMGLSTLRRLFARLDDENLIIVLPTGLTQRASQEVKHYNSLSTGGKVYIATGIEAEELEPQLREIIGAPLDTLK